MHEETSAVRALSKGKGKTWSELGENRAGAHGAVTLIKKEPGNIRKSQGGERK